MSINNDYYPLHTDKIIRCGKIIKRSDKIVLSERLSTRMTRSAAVIPQGEFIGWQIFVPKEGVVDMGVFGSEGIGAEDLEWMLEKTAQISEKSLKINTDDINSLTELYELYLPIREKEKKGKVGFASEDSDMSQYGEKERQEFGNSWPMAFSEQFAEMIKAFRTTGACFRAVLGSCSEQEGIECKNNYLSTADLKRVDSEEYIGKPVKTRFLLRLPCKPSLRLQTVIEEAVSSTELRYLGKMSSPKTSKIWNEPLKSGIVLPDIASRILIMEPDAKKIIIGIEHCEEPVEKRPAEHDNTKNKKAIVIGKALGTNGLERKITIGDLDLRRHYEIVGQTGTGKSTLLANMVLSAIDKGYGLTFFDPHGSTIDVILKCVPSKYADRIRVVRVGDAEHPVPLNLWESGDISKEEKNINDLCELLADIFDPKREGIVGPRYERIFSTMAKASIAFLGKRASLESISVIAQSKDNLLKMCKSIIKKYPLLVETIKQEYGQNNSSDYNEVMAWFISKFQRLTAVEQLRNILGAGVDALDFKNSIDTDSVTLIDLASPIIGTHAARIIGTLMLMKLWNATMMRKNRDMTHLVVIDEAALFQTNPMPRMLAESRKFGLAMVLSHQHEGQLTRDIRDALEANSANFSAFRISPTDAERAWLRFDDRTLVNDLTRLDAFNAITTLSVDGRQTAPFTLQIEKTKKQKDGELNAEMIEKDSIKKLVEPYYDMRALSANEIQDILNNAEKYTPEEFIKIKRRKSTFFDDWKRKKKALEMNQKKEPRWLVKWKDYKKREEEFEED